MTAARLPLVNRHVATTRLCALVTILAGGALFAVASAQLDRPRLEIAHADADRLRAARELRPADANLRLVFIRPSRSNAAAQGVELRFADGVAVFLGPGTFAAVDVTPGSHTIQARTLWGYVQSISFTLDHGTSQRFDREDPGVPGPCCPKAVVRELSEQHQRLAALNWEAHRFLWDVPEHLATDARTDTTVEGYQNRLWARRWLDMEIGGKAGEILFFRLDPSRHGEIELRPLGRRRGTRLVRRYPLTAVRLQLVKLNTYDAPPEYSRAAAPYTSHGIMSNGLLDPLGPRVPGLAQPGEAPGKAESEE